MFHLLFEMPWVNCVGTNDCVNWWWTPSFAGQVAVLVTPCRLHSPHNKKETHLAVAVAAERLSPLQTRQV